MLCNNGLLCGFGQPEPVEIHLVKARVIAVQADKIILIERKAAQQGGDARGERAVMKRRVRVDQLAEIVRQRRAEQQGARVFQLCAGRNVAAQQAVRQIERGGMRRIALDMLDAPLDGVGQRVGHHDAQAVLFRHGAERVDRRAHMLRRFGWREVVFGVAVVVQENALRA